ncbi:MAG: RNA polymerase sigma factor [Candidatus Nanoarchaeia archaeon]|nr:RNA polymerase sigma factor [Candidatus Nanoarchaeia archaeon]MDD5740947.1 RNA polymerase sigma factor [Candidatus Nanoarchaeia archaeon]
MGDSEGDEDLSDLRPFEKRGENAKRLINLIEKDMGNGRVLYNHLLNYSKKLVGNYHDAEDVVSHFILNLIDGKAFTYKYNLNGSVDWKLKRWLCRGVRNLSISLLRNKGILNVYPNKDDEDFVFFDRYLSKQKQEEVPERRVSRKETRKVVFENILHIRPEYRSILTQRYFNHASYKKISETQHIPIGTVKSRLHTAKKKFSRLEGVIALAAN